MSVCHGAEPSPRKVIFRDVALTSRRIGLAATTVMLAATMVIAFAAPI